MGSCTVYSYVLSVQSTVLQYCFCTMVASYHAGPVVRRASWSRPAAHQGVRLQSPDAVASIEEEVALKVRVEARRAQQHMLQLRRAQPEVARLRVAGREQLS